MNMQTERMSDNALRVVGKTTSLLLAESALENATGQIAAKHPGLNAAEAIKKHHTANSNGDGAGAVYWRSVAYLLEVDLEADTYPVQFLCKLDDDADLKTIAKNLSRVAHKYHQYIADWGPCVQYAIGDRVVRVDDHCNDGIVKTIDGYLATVDVDGEEIEAHESELVPWQDWIDNNYLHR
jgi:hypothetical protein